jgi:hypothetical protein
MYSQKIFQILILALATSPLSAVQHTIDAEIEGTKPLEIIDSSVHETTLIPRSNQPNWEKIDDEDSKQQQVWFQQQASFAGYNASSNVTAVTSAMQKLGLNEKPLAFGQRTYIKQADGSFLYTTYMGSPDKLAVKDFGLSPEKLAFVAKDDEEHRETFTSTLPKGKTYKANRKHPFSAFSLTIKNVKIDFDAGHGIDQADTVLANGRDSSTDADNFVPQNRYYNQKIRNHMVNHAIRGPNGSYKEISVYDKDEPIIHTLSNGEKCHIPIGFIFIIFKNHEVTRTFYFPNLISYESLIQEQKLTPNYVSMMKYFELSKEVVSNRSITVGDTDGQTRAVSDHSNKGYRSLSGRYDVVSHLTIPRPAKAALRRLLAIYHMEQAAHLEYRCVEEKAQLVEIYTRHMKYFALDKATKQEREIRKQAYWQAYKDEEQKLAENNGISVDLVDYALDMGSFLLRIHNKIPANDPIELALQRVQERHKALEKGQSLYNPERAKIWLARIEDTVSKSLEIEDIIRLLNLYDIPDVQDKDKKLYFEELLEQRGALASLDHQKQIGDYFNEQLSNEERTAESKALQQKVEKWKVIVEHKIANSKSVEELTEAAEWYHGGRGMFNADIDKARQIYKRIFRFVDAQEQSRINYCLEDLDKREAYVKAHRG